MTIALSFGTVEPMSKRQRKYACGYCGEVAPATDDHIPPRSFFSANASLALRTVKACESCNSGSSDADEYFRDIVVQFAPVSVNPKAQPQVEKLRRALVKPQKRAYAERTMNAIEEHDVVTPGGIHLGKHPFVKVDADLLQRATQRYVRGLFRYEFGKRVPDDYIVSVATNPDDVESQREKVEKLVGAGIVTTIEKGVFWYSFTIAKDNPDVSAWALVFYDAMPVLGVVGPSSRADGLTKRLKLSPRAGA